MTKTKTYKVANPRDIPEGRYIIRQGDRYWFEGDTFDGVPTERLVKGKFLVEVKHGEG